MNTRDIVERLSPRITKKARKIIDDSIEALQAMGEDEEDKLELNALQVVMAVYDVAPDARAEILSLRRQLAEARDAALEEAAGLADSWANPEYSNDAGVRACAADFANAIRALKGRRT